MSKRTVALQKHAAASPSDSEVAELLVPSGEQCALKETIAEAARMILQTALEAEADDFLDEHADRCDVGGHRLVVRNGYLPLRDFVTGAGRLRVRQPRVRDNWPERDKRVHFSSRFLPP